MPKETIQVKPEDIYEFIIAQPDEREVDMLQTDRHAICGCVMVHYGIDKGFAFDFVGSANWVLRGDPRTSSTEVARIPNVYSIFHILLNRGASKPNTRTYAQLKARIPHGYMASRA